MIELNTTSIQNEPEMRLALELNRISKFNHFRLFKVFSQETFDNTEIYREFCNYTKNSVIRYKDNYDLEKTYMNFLNYNNREK